MVCIKKVSVSLEAPKFFMKGHFVALFPSFADARLSSVIQLFSHFQLFSSAFVVCPSVLSVWRKDHRLLSSCLQWVASNVWRR